MKYEPHPNRRRLLIGLTAFCAVPLPVRAKLTSSALVGAGASLPTKLYEAWGKRFTELTQVPFHYAAVGSGQGWQLITAGNGPSQKSGQILSLKYAFTLGNENDKSHQSPEEKGMH